MTPPLSISQQQARIERILKEKNFGRFSDRLADVIFELWQMAGDDVLEFVGDYLGGRSGKFTAADFRAIDEVARQSMRTAFGTNLSPIVQSVTLEAYGRGLNEIRAGFSKSFNLVDKQAVAFIHEHHMYWSLGHYENDTTDRMKRLADTVISSGMSRRDAGRFFENTIGKELKRDRAYWELTADAITTRSRSFSNISAFERAGVERYIISIVDDHRTSDICRYLGGKEVAVVDKETGESKTVQLSEEERTFDVAAAAGVRDAMLAAKTPEEAKEIMPWKGVQRRVERGESTAQMSAGGVMMPPFHGRCRSRMVLA